MKNRIILLSISAVILYGFTLAGAFYTSQKLHNTYGFFSRSSPVTYRVTVEDNQLILDFSPSERGLGILELDIVRQSGDKLGTASVTMKEMGRGRILSKVKFTTTHIDSSRPLLIPFRDFAKLRSNEYRLTIQTDPEDLLPEYLVQQGLQAQGVYFIDRAELTHNFSEILRLIKWKYADLLETFSPIHLYLLTYTPLALPFVLFLLWYHYKKRLLRKVFIEYIIYYLLKPLEWSRQFDAKHLEPSVQNRRLMVLHYKKLLLFVVRSSYIYLSKKYVANKRNVWDVILVLVWASTNIVFMLTQKDLTDNQYIAFALSYIVFALFRRLDPRFHYLGALFTLIFCPYFLSLGLEEEAEKAAIFVYGFMVVGALFDAIELYRNRGKSE